jgi:hypothetical protein
MEVSAQDAVRVSSEDDQHTKYYPEDLSCALTLVDPSNLNVNNHSGFVDGLGCQVNCFTAKYEGWLPSPRNGDVLLLRGVKVSILFCLQNHSSAFRRLTANMT